MPKSNQPRAGSLQVWPRKRINKFLPSVNWSAIEKTSNVPGFLGFIGYKVGMSTALIKDKTPDSMSKDKKIPIPATVLELPPMKIFSVRFYKNGIVKEEVLSENLDKELKRVVKLPKAKPASSIDSIKDYDDVRVIAYSLSKQTGIKKVPDIIEIGISGKIEDKIKFIKEKLNKEIPASEVLKPLQLLDLRGLTKGKGLVGPMKRFGISKKSHKSQKGVRRPGSIGPRHPNVVIFRVPMAGQMGMFTRVHYNLKLITLGKIKEKNINPDYGWKNYGKIKSDYGIVSGSVQGPQKRQVLLTSSFRPTKKQEKKNYEFVKLM